MRGGSPHHAAVLPGVALQIEGFVGEILSDVLEEYSAMAVVVYLGSGAVAVRVLHAVVVLGRRGRASLQLSVGLVALGQGVDKLVAAHVHPQS